MPWANRGGERSPLPPLLHQGTDPAPAVVTRPRFSVAAVRPHGPRVPLVRLVEDPPDDLTAWSAAHASPVDGAVGEPTTVPHLAVWS
jgi:hypothetical protein